MLIKYHSSVSKKHHIYVSVSNRAPQIHTQQANLQPHFLLTPELAVADMLPPL